MLFSIEQLLGKNISNLQNQQELEIRGYSNFIVLHKRNYIETLVKIFFNENIVSKLLQPEILSFFPLKSKLYKGQIKRIGDIREIEIEFDNISYKKYKQLDNNNIKSILDKHLNFNQYTFYGIYNNIYIPSIVIGRYLYFPNTAIRRLYRNNNINYLIHKVDCKNQDIILKQNVKFDDITAIIIYLFKCNKIFSDAFSKSYAYNISFPLQKANQEDKQISFLPTIFEFPKFQGKYKLLVRGEQIDNYFLVYEILNFNFKQVVKLKQLEVSYKGKKQIRVFKSYSIATKSPTNQSNLSQTDGYNTDYINIDNSLIEIDTYDKDNINVEKVNPKIYREDFSKCNINVNKGDNEGLTLGSNRDKESNYSKANIEIKSINIDTIKKELKKRFKDISIITSIYNSQYSYIYFHLYNREYLLIKLNRPNTSWYILSTDNPPLEYKKLAYHLISIKDNKNNYYTSNKDFAIKIKQNYQICFHKSLKSNAESFEKWIERLVKRILDWKNCKGG